MSDVQEHLAKMLRIVGIEKITARNTEKVWVRIRMWEDTVRCSRWDADADDQQLTTVKEVHAAAARARTSSSYIEKVRQLTADKTYLIDNGLCHEGER
ncbi:hypothetical protein [Streptomyces sp. NPDC088141]|uniref:hypothetical protein n=1 Tax=unclassified Streptomyces TaxID=2593676 RepID=UPI00342838C5